VLTRLNGNDLPSNECIGLIYSEGGNIQLVESIYECI
jgi:hypothetical protein